MKNATRTFLFSLAGLVIVSLAQAAVPSMDIVVSNSSNKDVFKGTTDASGNFATGEMGPGNYVVKVNSKNAALKGTFGIDVAAGKESVSADSVSGQKIGGNGVALRLAVAGRAKITGRVAAAGTGAQKVANASASTKTPDQKTKMMNGKKFIWVPSNFETKEGAHWAEEGTEPAASSGNVKPTNSAPRVSGARGRY
jgi:hypothetical protein